MGNEKPAEQLALRIDPELSQALDIRHRELESQLGVKLPRTVVVRVVLYDYLKKAYPQCFAAEGTPSVETRQRRTKPKNRT